MVQTIPEATREIPVLEQTDVLVAGGGVSGFAAALAAARTGAKTMLLERNGCLGGVATATLMANIGNLYLTASGEQLTHGIAAEVVDRLVEVGGASPQWKNRAVPGCVIDSERLKVLLIEILEEAGVTTLTHALAARPIMEDSAVRGCFLESKSGRQAILAGNTIDATGEGDLAFQAGADIVSHRGNCSTLFKLGNVDLDRFTEFLLEDPEGFPDGRDLVRDVYTLAENWRERGVFFFPHYGGKDWRFVREMIEAGEFTDKIDPAFNLDVLGMYALAGRGTVAINSNYYIFESLDIRELSRYELHAQKMCYYVADFLKRKVPGFEGSHVEHIGVDLGLRGARYINGRETLRAADIVGPAEPRHFDDVIGVMPAQGARDSNEFFKDFGCDIPLGVTVPKGPSHLLVGSAKSISTEGGHKRLIRGMSGCMVIGQATGIAAGLGAASGTPAADVPMREVQKELLRQGQYLGNDERLKELGVG